MLNCPACGEKHGQFRLTVIARPPGQPRRSVDTYWCTRCEHEWQDERMPQEAHNPLSITSLDVA